MSRWIRRKGSRRTTDSEHPAPEDLRPSRASEAIESGLAAEARGEAAEAERCFRQALAIDSSSAAAHMNLGIMLQGRGDSTAAAAAHATAVALDPTHAHAHYNFGLAQLELGDYPGAEHGFREALRLRPEFPEAWVALADVLESTGRDEDALTALDSAIAQRPGYVGAMFNAGILLRKLGRLDEAEARLRGIPEAHPEYSNAMTALAAILRDQGRIVSALAVMNRVVDRNPDSVAPMSEYLFALGFSDRLSAEGLFAEHLWTGCRIEARTAPWRAAFVNAPEPDRVLNVGYLSGDFRGHSVAVFTEFLFERHRRSQVRIHAYSSTPVHDAMTAEFIAAADVWRDVRGQTDGVVANAILEDRIDILVDLSGHTSSGRPVVLAGRAAPIQMTWLGYIGSTGLTRVDYRITDCVADPQDTAEALHTERLLRLPHSQWCFRPPQAARELAVSRNAPDGAFTFGSFNQFAKISDSTVQLWIAVMRAAPEARLRIVGVPKGTAAESLRRKLAGEAIDSSRYDLVERVSQVNYYGEYRQVDACLDSTPYSGGTTTCDSFWMGVPVVTLAGTRSMSRSSASLLVTVGLADFVAQSAEEFAAIAVRLALKGPWATNSRIALRERFVGSPLMDEQGFTEDLERLYREAWRGWCASRPSKHG